MRNDSGRFAPSASAEGRKMCKYIWVKMLKYNGGTYGLKVIAKKCVKVLSVLFILVEI